MARLFVAKDTSDWTAIGVTFVYTPLPIASHWQLSRSSMAWVLHRSSRSPTYPPTPTHPSWAEEREGEGGEVRLRAAKLELFEALKIWEWSLLPLGFSCCSLHPHHTQIAPYAREVVSARKRLLWIGGSAIIDACIRDSLLKQCVHVCMCAFCACMHERFCAALCAT